jgi:hypothetical protein
MVAVADQSHLESKTLPVHQAETPTQKLLAMPIKRSQHLAPGGAVQVRTGKKSRAPVGDHRSNLNDYGIENG